MSILFLDHRIVLFSSDFFNLMANLQLFHKDKVYFIIY